MLYAFWLSDANTGDSTACCPGHPVFSSFCFCYWDAKIPTTQGSYPCPNPYFSNGTSATRPVPLALALPTPLPSCRMAWLATDFHQKDDISLVGCSIPTPKFIGFANPTMYVLTHTFLLFWHMSFANAFSTAICPNGM